MQINKNNLPVPYNQTFEIVDSTKLKTFVDCPRKYFLSFIVGLQQENKSIHLIFGVAWHEAMEYIRLNGYSHEAADAAGDILEKAYRDEGISEIMDTQYAPKNPGYGRIALHDYVEEYSQRDANITTLFTEVGGYIPIGDDRFLYGRIDFIGLDEQDRIFALDYKTGSRYSNAWVEQWKLDNQMLTYIHSLKSAFSTKEVFGIKVDGVILYKNTQRDIGKKTRFVRIPVRLNNNLMNSWLYDINYHYSMLEWNWRQLEECSKDDTYLQSFAKNPNSCTKYGLCPFHDICLSYPNPIELAHTPPPAGWKISHWNPTEQETKVDISKVANLL